MKKILVLFVFYVLVSPGFASSESLLVVYPDRPPYNYTVDGKAAGILVELTEKIFLDANLTPNFSEMPSARILVEIQKEGSKICSFGWFKNQEREKFATFTLPMYQDTPLVALILKENAQLFEGKSSLKDIAADINLSLGVVAGFSYGNAVDEILQKANVPTVAVPQRQQLGAMLALKRFSYMLIRPVEVEELVKLSGKNSEDFQSVSLSDVQDRGKRYIMCGKGIPNDVIVSLNTSIEINCTVKD